MSNLCKLGAVVLVNRHLDKVAVEVMVSLAGNKDFVNNFVVNHIGLVTLHLGNKENKVSHFVKAEGFEADSSLGIIFGFIKNSSADFPQLKVELTF